MKKPACASKRDVLELATLPYLSELKPSFHLKKRLNPRALAARISDPNDEICFTDPFLLISFKGF